MRDARRFRGREVGHCENEAQLWLASNCRDAQTSNSQYLFSTTKRDQPPTSAPYHLRAPPRRPIGPPPPRSNTTTIVRSRGDDNDRGVAASPLIAAAPRPSNSQNAVLLGLLDAIDDDELMPSRDAKTRAADETRWQLELGAALKRRKRPTYELYISERERELRRRLNLIDTRRQLSTETATATPSLVSLGRVGSFGGPLSASLSARSLSVDDEPMELELVGGAAAIATASSAGGNTPSAPTPLQRARQRRFSTASIFRSCEELDVVASADVVYVRRPEAERMAIDDEEQFCARTNGAMQRRDGFERFLRDYRDRTTNRSDADEAAQSKARFSLGKRQSTINERHRFLLVDDETDIHALRQAFRDDLADIDDPKTPITSANAATTVHTHHAPGHDTQQLFASAQTVEATIHSVLSPPASNEQADAAAMAAGAHGAHAHGAAATAAAAEKMAATPQQSLVSMGNSLIMLHSSGWNTVCVAWASEPRPSKSHFSRPSRSTSPPITRRTTRSTSSIRRRRRRCSPSARWRPSAVTICRLITTIRRRRRASATTRRSQASSGGASTMARARWRTAMMTIERRRPQQAAKSRSARQPHDLRPTASFDASIKRL